MHSTEKKRLIGAVINIALLTRVRCERLTMTVTTATRLVFSALELTALLRIHTSVHKSIVL
ncbi:MAG TPA: hypothetical protein VEF34_21760 [Syntrophobacteraceae bacterium]|nr:hypothetical protein [Syntrophobacteraceae bacterium]